MTDTFQNEDRIPVGHLWLRRRFGLRVPRPYVESYIVPGARRTEIHGARTLEYYGRSYLSDPSDLRAHLRFALRHEPTDLRVLVGALRAIGPEPIRRWVLDEPTGNFSRRAWFLYETFTGDRLDLEDVRVGAYVDALDPSRHIVAKRRNSPRHRVVDNLLGGIDFCPTVRRTQRLEELRGTHVDEEARRLLERYDQVTLARAISYLYTKETRSSFAIEGETPTPSKAGRFVAALRSADRFDPQRKAAILALQNQIVDPRYAAANYRDFQNFVGSTTAGFREEVHFICPRPEDVPSLMNGWSAAIDRLIDGLDPVVAAAVIAFAFVFIHPFEDGNGRIHRFLMHHVLARTGFSPPGIIFPVSAAIARDQRSYDAVLETFSMPILKYIDWTTNSDQSVAVHNQTESLYRYFDATLFAEYLHDRVIDTVHKDLRDELQFVAIFDAALSEIENVVSMPDRKASSFVRLCMQNGGRLSRRKRSEFQELTDAEVSAMEEAIRDIIAREANEHADLLPGLFQDHSPLPPQRKE